MFLQTVGLIPDNMIILESSRKKVEDRVKDKLKQIHSKVVNNTKSKIQKTTHNVLHELIVQSEQLTIIFY